MKKDIKLWQLLGFGIVSLLGTLLHFLYDWTESTFLALFSAVNESTFEHMKILFFPLFLFAIIESFFVGKEYENFWCVKLRGILLGIIMIPVIFYTLNGIFGKTPDWVNIAIFFICAAIAFIYETRQFLNCGSLPCNSPKWSLVALCLLAIAFSLFTFSPPKIPLFADPIDKTFGISL